MLWQKLMLGDVDLFDEIEKRERKKLKKQYCWYTVYIQVQTILHLQLRVPGTVHTLIPLTYPFQDFSFKLNNTPACLLQYLVITDQ